VNVNKLVSFASAVLGTVLVLICVGWLVWQWISPSFENFRNRENPNIVPFHVHFNYDADVTHIVLGGERLRDVSTPYVRDGDVYLPLDFIRGYIDPFMFWDAGARQLFVSSLVEMRSFRVGDVRYVEGNIFVPSDLVMGLYAVTVRFEPEHNMVVVTCDRSPQLVAQVNTSAPVRYLPDIAAPMAARLAAGTTVTVVGESDNGNWVRVRTDEGLLGYVRLTHVGERKTAPQVPPRTAVFAEGFVDNLRARRPNWDGDKINLVWSTANDMSDPLPPNLTVVSPTWFRFNADTRSLDSNANAAYARWAREQGVQVWPNVTDVYAGPEGRYSGAILSDFEARRRIIGQLVEFVDMLELDGLVINVESLRLFRYGSYYVQFMRELNLELGHRVVLAAAIKPDTAVNPHYRHDLIAKTVDFVALMTYDEHHGNSPVAGPVASLPWVERQIQQMLRLVPANQLLMGLPYYNRVWRTAITDLTRRGSFNWSMDWTMAQLTERGEVLAWDAVAGSYYAEWFAVVNEEALRHQIWLECPRSIGEKMRIFAAHDLAGVAGWSLGFTNEEVWDVLGGYFPASQ
jgi:spore germination protein YaaH